MKLKTAAWVAAALVGTLVVLTIAAAAGSRTEPLRKLVVATLEDRLNSHVELKAFSVDLFPAVTVQGSGLTLRLRNVTDPAVPPLIEIESFTVHCGIVDLLRRPRRFKHVTLEKLVVNIPPGGLKKNGNPIGEATKARDAAETAPSAEPTQAAGDRRESPIIVDELVADGALLRIIPRREGKLPKEFAIQALTMRSLGIAEQMPFTAILTNPLPKGQIETAGTFGPWQKGSPGCDATRGALQLPEGRSRYHQGHRRDPRFEGIVPGRAGAHRRQGRDARAGLSPRHQPSAGGAQHELRGRRRRHRRRHVPERSQRAVSADVADRERRGDRHEGRQGPDGQVERAHPGRADRGSAAPRGQGRQAAARRPRRPEDGLRVAARRSRRGREAAARRRLRRGCREVHRRRACRRSCRG